MADITPVAMDTTLRARTFTTASSGGETGLVIAQGGGAFHSGGGGGGAYSGTLLSAQGAGPLMKDVYPKPSTGDGKKKP